METRGKDVLSLSLVAWINEEAISFFHLLPGILDIVSSSTLRRWYWDVLFYLDFAHLGRPFNMGTPQREITVFNV